MRIAEVEVDPLRAPVRGALRDRPRARSSGARWCWCGCAPTRASSASARRCRCRCAAARPVAGRAVAAPHGQAPDAGWTSAAMPARAAERRRRRGDRRGRRAAAARAGQAAVEMAVFDLAGRSSRDARCGGCSARRAAPPVRCNATLVAGSPPERRRGGRRAGRSAASRPSSSRSGSATTSGRCGRCATRSARRRGSGSTPTAPGAPTRRSPCWTRWSRYGIELAEQPAADLEGMAAVPRQTAIPIAADESVDQRQGRERAVELGACQPGDGEAGEGRRDRPGARDRAPSCPSTCRAPSTGRSGSPPRRTPPRRSTAGASDAGPRPRPRHPAAVRRHDRLGASARCATGSCTCPTGPGSGSRSTSEALERAPPRSSRVPFAPVDPTNRNTALASALVEELARCGVRHAALAPGLALHPARAGAVAPAGDRGGRDRRRALRRLLRARRGPGERPAGRRPVHLGDRRRQPPPRRLRGRRGRRAR